MGGGVGGVWCGGRCAGVRMPVWCVAMVGWRALLHVPVLLSRTFNWGSEACPSIPGLPLEFNTLTSTQALNV